MSLPIEFIMLMLRRKYSEFNQQRPTGTWQEYETYAFNKVFTEMSQLIRNRELVHSLIIMDYHSGCDICNVNYMYYKYILERSLFAYWNDVNEIRLLLDVTKTEP
jgi:hypothetical protein